MTKIESFQFDTTGHFHAGIAEFVIKGVNIFVDEKLAKRLAMDDYEQDTLTVTVRSGVAMVICGENEFALKDFERGETGSLEYIFKAIISSPDIFDDFAMGLRGSDSVVGTILNWGESIIDGLLKRIPAPEVHIYPPFKEVIYYHSSELGEYLAADGGCQ